MALDGSVNSDFRGPVPLDGRDYDIRAHFGHVEGRNLFHSFQRFDLDTGQRAIFSAPEALRIGRVISRVTGGDRSEIDGTIRSDIAGADFYFINPAGVVFGPHASLDVQGSFHVSTADELRFPGGKIFSAANPADSSFSVAAPDAFGFLDRDAGEIKIDGSELGIAPDQALSLVGGDVVIDRGLIALRDFERNGNATLVAMSRPGTVAVADGRTSAAPEGGILVRDSDIDVSSAAGGGVVRIRAGELVVENSIIFANSGADEPGPATALIDIESERVHVDFTEIGSDAFGAGDAGDVQVKASALEISGGLISSDTFAAGNAGNIFIRTDQLAIRRGSPDFFTGISSSVQLQEGAAPGEATGDAGNVTVLAGEVSVRDSGVIFSVSSEAGDAGSVELTANRIELRTGGQVGSGTGLSSTGRGGDVTLSAHESLTISGQSPFGDTPSGIFASTESDAADAGRAGDATITAPVITITDRGEISSESFNAADGGELNVTATDRLLIDAGEISTEATGAGAAGAIRIRAGALELRNVSSIHSNAEGTGGAGSVRVEASGRLFLLEGSDVSTESAAAGGGRIRLLVGDAIVLRDSEVVTSVAGGEDPTAGNILIDPKVLVIDNSVIQANAPEGFGGDIDIFADNAIVPEGSLEALIGNQITASGEVGGSVSLVVGEVTDVSADLLVLEGALLDAAAQLRERCAARRDVGASSFTGVGRGGLPPGPDAPLFGAYVVDEVAAGEAQRAGSRPGPGTVPASVRLAGLIAPCAPLD